MFAGVLPVVLSANDPWRGAGVRLAVVVLAGGLLILLWCVRDFYISGKGTLAPWDPPRHLVVVGLYRFARNPMYIGVLAIVAGWSLLRGSPVLAGYLAALSVAFYVRVRWAEEPWLAKRFGAEWTEYMAAVPRWVPRLTPWTVKGKHP